MSLSVADALRDGLGRTFERNGLQLIAVFVVVRLASTVATDTLNRANLALARELGAVTGESVGGVLPGLAEAPTPFALGLGVGAALVLAVAVALVAEAVRIVAVRTFVGDRVDVIRAEDRRRNLATATVNGFVGGVVVVTLTVIGLVLLVVPGVYLALSFFFVRQEIAVRDVNFAEAMGGSWELAAGNRLDLLALAVALLLAVLAASVPAAAVGALSPAAGAAVGAVTRAVVVVFAVASVSRAYAQLRDDDADAAGDAPTYEGALTADDLPPPDDDRGPGGSRGA